ncbi:hypothetical protein Bsel_2624 [[Bacillus] selenitireducens MLS10]|uniref:Uncharacterized protein n=1 Tax=Bacillus selenitireducens (strain ATCC 700615 / DSM 15326 / MLS10) TaxID=439292 RepID=D6XXT1_BACIE|nr:hypothetical protein Bsel_2624 [[Bacillus] selenitireducens MLS10]
MDQKKADIQNCSVIVIVKGCIFKYVPCKGALIHFPSDICFTPKHSMINRIRIPKIVDQPR